ncbi:IMPACT family protein [Olleya aquimaris]|uniref:Putative YigZ family protein n=1 Tax=Olleya aquimaris TaxID=639310 RepID=A0A327RMH9_9FLAO|nr:YigZ family protein [Olleya aquimaris]RAJ17102.1 putative YigZ family protein [Olleya aquimaris]
MENDTYKTILKPSKEVLHKDKNSKFYSYTFPVTTEEDVKSYLEVVKQQHPKAGHFCYAYQLGKEPDQQVYRANDDGEPSNSAGLPIYGQIQSFEVTNILIVVVRYFGGVKLGVGGLINAYRTGAQLALEASTIVERTINIDYLITCDYDVINKVMRVIKEKNLNITDQKLELDCQIWISVRKKEAANIFSMFDSIFKVTIKKTES